MAYELLLKQTFRNQLRALPKDQRAQILDKIDLLYDDPAPDGHLKKKIHEYKQELIFRLRSGDYRILYTYGEGWVKVLWVEHRATIYNRLHAFDQTRLPPEAFEDVEFTFDAPPLLPSPSAGDKEETPLPVPITEELLHLLGIPGDQHTALLTCQTLDDLVRAKISEEARTLIFDAVSTPDVAQVLEQPEYVAPKGNDLLRFKEGELVDFLLRLSPDQERFVTWGLNATGPTLVKGGPGSGKSTVALYRVRELLRVLRAAGQPQPRILFTTYTNALVTFSRQLLRTLLGDDVACVEVRTADSLAREIAGVDKHTRLATPVDLRQVMRQAIRSASFEGNMLQKQAQNKTINALDLDYLIEEITDVIEARQLTSLEAYQATPRPGRTQPLNEIQRQAVWQVREGFVAALMQASLLTWQQLRAHAEEIVRSGAGPERFDAVIIDEAQDLDPSLLRMLIELCRAPNRLFVTADANQSIYSSSFRWSDVHEQLQFRGRTGVLRVNYRSTREIGEAAHSYLGSELLDTDQIESYLNSGPQPAMRGVAHQAEEVDLLTRFLPAAAREARLGLGACAILCPTKDAGQSIATDLTKRGLEATFMTGQDLNLARRGIKVMTLKSSKGLEFPVVAIAGFFGGSYPIRRNAMTDDDWDDLLAKERRTLFVSMTRAMRALLVIAPTSTPSPGLSGFDSHSWNLE